MHRYKKNGTCIHERSSKRNKSLHTKPWPYTAGREEERKMEKGREEREQLTLRFGEWMVMRSGTEEKRVKALMPARPGRNASEHCYVAICVTLQGHGGKE